MERIVMAMMMTAIACQRAGSNDGPRPAPPCTTVGSIPYWAQEDAFESFLANRDAVDALSLFWYHLDPDGAVKPYRRARESRELVMTSRALGVKVLALVANLPDDEREGPGLTWDARRVRKVLRGKTRRQAHVADVVALARRMHFDGILIDYEALPRSQRRDFTAFIAELGAALHADGRVLAVAIHPKTRENDPREANGSEAQDWDELARHADQLHFMTYAQHTGDTPGPVASLAWTERVLRYAVEQRRLPRSKIFVGLPLYAEQWADHGGRYAPLGDDLTYADVEARRQRFGGRIAWSRAHHSPSLRYRDRDDVQQLVWFENQRSIEAKLALARELGLCNFALWRLGGEDPGFWPALRELRASVDGEGGEPVGDSGAAEATASEEDVTDDDSLVRVTGELTAEVEYYTRFAFEQPEHERDNFMTNAFFWQTIALGDHLAFDQDVRIVIESDGEDERYYSDYRHRGIYVRTLRLRYQRGPVTVFGGRYEPAAGLRSDKAIFFGNYSTNLELEGQLGGGIALHVADGDGRHAVTGHVFRRDTSRLRGELLTDRARDYDIYGEEHEYGPPDSYLVTLEGSQPWGGAPIGYAIGGGRQGRGIYRDQDLVFGNLFGGVPLAGEHVLRLSVDAIYLRNAQGQAEDRTILGGGIGYVQPRAYVGAAYSARFADYAEMSSVDRTDQIFEVVARFAVTPRMIAEAAYQRSAEWHATENALGFTLRYLTSWGGE